MTSRARIAVGGALLLTLAGAACADESGAGSGDDTTVNVALADWSVQIDPGSVPAGPITFSTTNEGPTTHEFEIFAGENGEVPSEPLPVSDGVADTAGLTLVDEVEDVFAGTEAELTATLEAGQYLIICNLPDHYEQGMTATLTVT
jgi:uncharacterized cupredoxin-like copper-binding protein